MKVIEIFSFSLIFLFSCQAIGDIKATEIPPDWVTKEPKIEGMICAVGVSEPTFYSEDAKQYAGENARKELARILSIEIKTIMVDIISDKGGSVDEGTVMQVSLWATSAVIENSKMMGYWYDAEGSVSQKKKVTYGLCCMPRKFNKDDLRGRLKSDITNSEEISRSVTEIINKLEERK
jgi:hypothetical protein